MEIQTQEARIILAIEAIQSSKKLSRRSAAKLYIHYVAVLPHSSKKLHSGKEYRTHQLWLG
jgi:hypothetical protein